MAIDRGEFVTVACDVHAGAVELFEPTVRVRVLRRAEPVTIRPRGA